MNNFNISFLDYIAINELIHVDRFHEDVSQYVVSTADRIFYLLILGSEVLNFEIKSIALLYVFGCEIDTILVEITTDILIVATF
jgi:hypothetical protein